MLRLRAALAFVLREGCLSEWHFECLVSQCTLIVLTIRGRLSSMLYASLSVSATITSAHCGPFFCSEWNLQWETNASDASEKGSRARFAVWPGNEVEKGARISERIQLG